MTACEHVRMKSPEIYHIVLLNSSTLLVKSETKDWRELNRLFGDMKACMGPWTFEAACEWMVDEWGPGALSNPWLSDFPSSSATIISI